MIIYEKCGNLGKLSENTADFHIIWAKINGSGKLFSLSDVMTVSQNT